MALKITLKQNWDELPSGEFNPSPFFSGREKEIAVLTHAFLHKRSGSILVSARRGTGKTDLVYKALKATVKKDSKIIPVVINATQISELASLGEEETKDREEKLSKVLKTLITRTYSVCSEGLKKNRLGIELADLYRQASGSYHESIAVQSSQSKEISKEGSTETKIFGRISPTKFRQFINLSLPSLMIGLTPVLSGKPLYVQYLVATIVLLPVVLVQFIDLEVTGEAKKATSKKDKDSSLEIAHKIYLRDNSYSNLEFGFKLFLENLQKENRKIIFVIDELDKLGDDVKKVIKSIKSFKNLFNHSDAIFVFIAAEDSFEHMGQSRSLRDTESTLFSQTIYITRPKAADFKEYLKKIAESSGGEDFDLFCEYVIYCSRLDFYNLQNILRDHVSYENGKAVLTWNKDLEALRKVNQQSIITALLEGRYFYEQQSALFKNEYMLNAAYLASEAKTYPINPSENAGIDAATLKTIDAFLTDLFKFYATASLYELQAEVPPVPPATTAVPTYVATVNEGVRITKLTGILEFEQSFVERIKAFEQKVLRVYNYAAGLAGEPKQEVITSEIIEGVKGLSGLSFAEYAVAIAKKEEIKRDVPQGIHPHNQEHLNEVGDAMETISLDKFINIAYNTISSLAKELNLANSLATPELLDELPEIKGFLAANTTTHIVLKTDSPQSINIFLFDPAQTILGSAEAIKEIKDHKVRVLELYENQQMKGVYSQDLKKKIQWTEPLQLKRDKVKQMLGIK